MNFWTKTIFCIILIMLHLNSWGQLYFDIVGNYVQLKSKNNEFVITELNLAEAYYEYAKVKVASKMGSYKIRYRDVKPKAKTIKINSFDANSVNYTIDTKKILLTLNQNPTSNSYQLHFCAADTDTVFNHWHIAFVKQKNDTVVGGGMQFSNYHRNNRKTIHLAEENGIGRGSGNLNKWTRMAGVNGKEYSTYCPISYFRTTNLAFETEGHNYSEINITNTAFEFTLFAKEAILNIYYSEPDAELKKPLYDTKISQWWYTEKLPKWALGTIVGLQGGAENVSEKVNFLLENGVHIDALWIQDWVGKRTTKYGSRLNWKWQLDTVSYARFEIFKAELKQKNIKLLGYINPFFAEEGLYTKEGIEKGFFIQNELEESLTINFGGMKGYMLDLFNPYAYSWMKRIITTNLINNGFDGWMADFAEWYPLQKGIEFSTSVEKHNQYPVLWAQLNREVIKESGKELVFFNRSGGFETSKYSNMMWLGDQLTDYNKDDGLPSVITAYKSAAASGLPLVHSDVGGYTSVKKPIIKDCLRDENLLKDWMLLEAFTPIFRTHEGLLPEANAQVYSTIDMAKIFGRFSLIHQKLMDSDYFFSANPRDYIVSANLVLKTNFGEHAMAVGSDIIIAYAPDFKSFDTNDWVLVNHNGQLSDQKLPQQKVIILLRKDSQIALMLQ